MGETMIVMWHVNIPLNEAAKHLGLNEPIYGGWLSGLLKQLKKQKDLKLVICFFNQFTHDPFIVDNVTYYPLAINSVSLSHYKAIIEAEKPDMIHVFGTEFPQGSMFIDAFNSASHTILQLQGLVSYIGESYLYGIPKDIIYQKTLRDFIKKDSLFIQQKVFLDRSLYEKKMIQSSNFIIGRTSFDENYAHQIHQEAHYEKIDEILRDSFYEHTWNIDQMNRHQILINQAHYPIKGFHLILPYLETLTHQYKDLKIIVVGKKPYDDTSLKSRLKISRYGLYIKQLIKKYGLSKYILFTGELSEKEMVEVLNKSHVYFSSSIIENESNALSEALLCGIPSVVSSVGGISSRLHHGKNGLSYSLTEIKKSVDLIKSIFDDDQQAISLSNKSKEEARVLFDSEVNSQKVIQLYQKIK